VSGNYPHEADLKLIADWPHTDLMGLFAFIEERWEYPEYWHVRGRTIRFSTGGWSGNESLVGALQDNRMAWVLCWQSSKRGGHFVFEIPECNVYGDGTFIKKRPGITVFPASYVKTRRTAKGKA